MHPIIAEHLARITQRDRLAEAARHRLAREARAQPRESRTSERRPSVAANHRSVFAVLRSLGS